MNTMPTTPKLDKVIALAEAEARAHGCTCVSTEFVLLAMAKIGAGQAWEILNKARLTPAKIERRIIT